MELNGTLVGWASIGWTGMLGVRWHFLDQSETSEQDSNTGTCLYAASENRIC